MSDYSTIPTVTARPAKDGFLRCICPYCGEPHFHAGAGLHLSHCKNVGLRGTYHVALDDAGCPGFQS